MRRLLFLLLLLPLFCLGQSSPTQVHNGVFYFGDTAWTDIKAPATTIRQGATTKPDFNTDSLTLDFPQNDETEVAYINLQFGHDYKEGSDVSPHIHYIQDEADTPTFKLDYRWIENGEATTAFTTIESTNPALTRSYSSQMQILEFPDISGSTITGVSSMLQIRLYRKTADGVAGDVLVLEFDCHYQFDSPGSDREYSKSW